MLLQKGHKFEWTEEAQRSFVELKSALTSSPVLATPHDEGDFTLDTDASNDSIGAVLSQNQDGTERVIAFGSRSLDKRERYYCVTRKELLAVVHFLRYFKQYLLGRKFRIRADHAALTWLKRTPDPIGQQARWLEQMEEFDFSVEHRPGTRHGNADALSRRPCPKKNCVCQQPDTPLFSGPADQLVRVQTAGCDDVTPRNPQLCRSSQVDNSVSPSRKVKRRPRRSPLSCGPADRGRSRVHRRYRLSWPAIPPNLDTIGEVDEVVEGALETHLNPEAEPFVPANEVVVAAVYAESDSSVDPPTSTPSEPPAVEDQEVLPWSVEGLIAAQKSDPDIGLIYQLVESGTDKPSWNEVVQYSENVKTLWSFWPPLSIWNGLLQRKFTCIEQQSEYWQTVMPRSSRQEFIQLVHGGATGGHFGVKKTSASVQSRAYWPSWASDVDSVVKKCAVCAQYHRGALPRQAALQTPVVSEPWERISIDITGPHPKSSRQNVYILTLVDHFSMWAEAMPIPNHTAATVAKALMVHVFSRYGLPAEVLSDRGSEFESELFAQLMKWLEVDKLRTTAYKP